MSVRTFWDMSWGEGVLELCSSRDWPCAPQNEWQSWALRLDLKGTHTFPHSSGFKLLCGTLAFDWNSLRLPLKTGRQSSVVLQPPPYRFASLLVPRLMFGWDMLPWSC